MRIYTRGEPPPRRRLNLVDPTGLRVVWTGHGWYDPRENHGVRPSLCEWPPHGAGPWRSLTP